MVSEVVDKWLVVLVWEEGAFMLLSGAGLLKFLAAFVDGRD